MDLLVSQQQHAQAKAVLLKSVDIFKRVTSLNIAAEVTYTIAYFQYKLAQICKEMHVLQQQQQQQQGNSSSSSGNNGNRESNLAQAIMYCEESEAKCVNFLSLSLTFISLFSLTLPPHSLSYS